MPRETLDNRIRHLLDEILVIDSMVETATLQAVEALKDGVHLRPWTSPLSSDSFVLLRPQISREAITKGLSRVVNHCGKPYDFDFNFARSDRLVCTEVVYRAYDGVEGISLPLKFRAGRPNLSGSDLVELACTKTCFLPVCCYAPQFASRLVEGSEAAEVMRRAISTSG